ncbi:tetratricopeptide repeat protein 1 isoform X1 [Neltuma alba]|uniref:tetratricopeptide repeat protein 1 isoform X1 n=1 Tax=Neltuma alba TaxID=207710 RepID=UPI0010A2FE4B|nr:tetratricopeptide repeat protein 1-like isoform X1 [Prosopis alba]
MVVIQPEETETERKVVNPSESAKTAKSSASSHVDDHKEASDGFETASDTELGSDAEDTHNERGQQHQDQEVGIPPGTESSEEASHDEELKQQKALAQANDAKLEGNKLFGDARFEEALSKYELALQIAPDMPSSVEVRSICHSNRAVCFMKLGKYEDTIKECTKALELNPAYLKALVRRGEAHEKLEHFEEAIADMKKIIEIDPSNDQARRTIRRLEPLAAEKREKMKEEMIGKLKDMGNSLLGRFGMSVDNFKAVQDPNTGSYSISFQR